MRSTIGSSDYQHILTIDICPLRVNWSQVILDMKSAGKPYIRQALDIGLEASTLRRWLEGTAEPGFSNGHALLILHSKVCGIEMTQMRLLESKQKD